MEEESRKFDAADQFRSLADLNFENKNLSDACFYYINCLRLKPEWKAELKNRFLFALSCLGQMLEKTQCIREMFTLYEEAKSLYPESEEVYHNLGAHLLRLGCPDKAQFYFKDALERNQNYFPAYRSLQSAYCLLIERWHYRMLNDTYRNEAYKQAIYKKVKQGFDTVLDIGTGTGLFCLYALEAGAKTINACDYNPVMISIAEKVFSKINSSDKIRFLPKHSRHMEVPKDMDSRVSLVVTETMDSCMLGEHMLQSLKHAWENLLLPPYKFEPDKPILNTKNNGIVIPHSGTLWFAGIYSNLLARKYIFPLDDLCANEFVDAFANISLKDNLLAENVGNLSLKNINLYALLNEPYDTERLQSIPGCMFVTEPCGLFDVNFNDPQHIEECLYKKTCRTFDIPCIRSGYLHAFGAWFKVHLDEDIVLCSAPDDVNSKNCCWDQAIFPTLKPCKVAPGCKISVTSYWNDGKVSFTMPEVTDVDGSSLPEPNTPILPVSSPMISMLNDCNLLEHLKIAAIELLCTVRGCEKIRLMDLFPVPIFGLNVLVNSHLANLTARDVEVVCVAQSTKEVTAVQEICKNNQIPFSQLSFVAMEDFDKYICSLAANSFDAILMNFIDFDGDLNEEAISRVNTLRPLLKDNGHLLPKVIKICGRLIHSDYIEESMRVLRGDEVQRCGISSIINEYQVEQILDLNVATLQYENHSSTFCCPHFFLPHTLDYEVVSEFSTSCTQSGTINSVLYWYNVGFFDDRHFYSTLHEFSYVSQAAYLTKSPVTFYENDNVCLKCVYHHGAFVIMVSRS